jgi:N utilization substance protein B
VSARKAAREFCFQYFFHLQLPVFEELKRDLNEDAIKLSIDEVKESLDVLFDADQNSFVTAQVKTTLENYSSIQEKIDQYSKNWKSHRLSRVDFTNLLLSINELLFTKSTPAPVVINEAVEISKKFGTKDSASFVNGLLDSIVKNENI